MAGAIVTKSYYIYEWYNVDSGEVFYVGKGSGRRKDNVEGRNKYFKNYYGKYNCAVRIVVDNLFDEAVAYQLETDLICKYKECGLCFTNMTNGGETHASCSGELNGMYGKRHSQETREKISKILKDGGKFKGEKNLQYGVSLKDRMDEETYNGWIEKHKRRMSGKNNPQYGVSPYDRIPTDKIEDWKKHISDSCKDELNGNAKKIRMYKENFSMEFPMLKRCAEYITDAKLSRGKMKCICSNISTAASNSKSYLGFMFEYID